MVEKVFLTEERQRFLDGGYEGAAARKHRSRIRNRSQIALKELIEVANSPEIDNEEVFEIDLIYSLIFNLFLKSGLTTSEGQFQANQAYRDELYRKLDQFLKLYQSYPDE